MDDRTAEQSDEEEARLQREFESERDAQLLRDGWHRQAAVDWKTTALVTMRGDEDALEIRPIVRRSAAQPDYWRIHEEGPGTPDETWNYAVHVLELLFMTTEGQITKQQRQAVNALWWAMDDSATWHTRVYCLAAEGHIVRAFEDVAFYDDLNQGRPRTHSE